MFCVRLARLRLFPSISAAVVLFSSASVLFAQFRGGSDWSTRGSDAQRSSWVRTDPKISPASLDGARFQLLWKRKLADEPLSAPVLLDRYIGYRGFRTYAFVGGHSEDAFGLDSDLGRLEWQKHLAGNSGGGSGSCAGGMTAPLARSVSSELSSNSPGGGYGRGRGGPAKSGVGEPLDGAVTLSQVAASRSSAPPPNAPNATRPAGTAAPPRPFGPRPTLLYSLSGDGTLHTMYVSNGEEAAPGVPFLPSKANVSDFSVVDGFAYAATVGHCGGVPDGLWAVDLTTKAVTKWEGSLAGGGPAFGPTAAYLTAANKLIALDGKTLTAGSSYDAGQAFATAPIVFEYKTKVMVAAATIDGALHLVDSTSLASAVAKSAAADPYPYALATWQTAAETRWIIVTTAKSITAWKIVDKNEAPTLQQGWLIHDVKSSSPPLIINGVLFALARGDTHQHAILSAFDAMTGKQLWSSGDTIASFVPESGGLAAGGSSLYFGTHDGTLWDFGFPIEH